MFMYKNFIKYCLSNGATLNTLLVNPNETKGMGLCNPSVFIDEDDSVKFIVRNVNYMLWNSDDSLKFTSIWGPLCYITPEHDQHLRTQNFLYNTTKNTYKLINTKDFDKEPLWEFVGLEDARLVRWGGKLYATGVRRDTTTNGQGRMELSEIDEENCKEISRVRIKSPGLDNSYCEKNWMPVIDKEYHYVKWCNPFELVKVNPVTGDCETVKLIEIDQNFENLFCDNMTIRGSSQVIPYKDGYIAVVHRCHLYINEKGEKCDTGYYEQFILWDKDFNLKKISKLFKFADFGIEFMCGLAHRDNEFYIPFALQDNIAFYIKVKDNIVDDFINDKAQLGNYKLDNNIFLKIFQDSKNSYNCYELGNWYFSQYQIASAMVLYERACEYNTFHSLNDYYKCLYMIGRCFQITETRPSHECAMWLRMIDTDPSRSEGYLLLSNFYYCRNDKPSAYTFAKLAYEKNNYGDLGQFSEITRNIGEIHYIRCLYETSFYKDCDDMLLYIINHTTDKYTELDKKEAKVLYNQIIENKNKKERVL